MDPVFKVGFAEHLGKYVMVYKLYNPQFQFCRSAEEERRKGVESCYSGTNPEKTFLPAAAVAEVAPPGDGVGGGKALDSRPRRRLSRSLPSNSNTAV